MVQRARFVWGLNPPGGADRGRMLEGALEVAFRQRGQRPREVILRLDSVDATWLGPLQHLVGLPDGGRAIAPASCDQGVDPVPRQSDQAIPVLIAQCQALVGEGLGLVPPAAVVAVQAEEHQGENGGGDSTSLSPITHDAP